MIGTIVNTAAIVVGSAIGSLAKRGLGEKYQNILFCAMGLAATGLGLHSVVEGMSGSVYPVLFIASLAIGGVVGTAIDIEGRFDRLTERLSKSKVPREAFSFRKASHVVFRPASCCSASARFPSWGQSIARFTATRRFCSPTRHSTS